ncbi:MAG: universal stress protein A [Methyloceanibacter sp.]|nr:MAG: universal stress protein A [Methyloceanibacter sp.]
MKPVRVLLPINAKGTTSACSDAAFGLARRFEAELEVLHPCPPPSQRLPYATELSPIYFEAYLDVSRKQVDDEEKQATAWFEKTSAKWADVESQLLTVEGLVGPAVAQRAKTADFSVLPTVAAAEDEMFDEARDAALFSSGRPVLFVPDEAGGNIGETIVIAWKDAVESARAVACAGPFLEAASLVRLVSLIEEGEEEDETALAMANYLAAACLPVELQSVRLGARDVGDAILEEAGSGVLLVMGGYGRWRWQEWVFGGATDYVLRNTDVAVLMSH